MYGDAGGVPGGLPGGAVCDAAGGAGGDAEQLDGGEWADGGEEGLGNRRKVRQPPGGDTESPVWCSGGPLPTIMLFANGYELLKTR